MVPDLPILTHIKYRSGFTGACYDPRTLITRLPLRDHNSLDESDFESHATIIHERVHWLQHHGTSFGCFLEVLRLSQMMTTLRWLREMPVPKIQNLLHQRTNLSKPIIAIDSKKQYPIFDDEGDGDYEMSLFKQIWFDHQWTHNVLENSNILQTGLRQIPESVFGEVVGDIMLTLCVEFDFSPYTKNTVLENSFEPRKWFSISENEMIFSSWMGLHLTSRALMECSATIAEIQTLLSSGWIFLGRGDLGIALRNRVKRIIEGDYGLPIRILLQVLNVDLDNLECLLKILPTVNLLCFIALNPPLPPYVMCPPHNAPSWQWQDIYPPIRFLRLAQRIDKFGLLKDCRDHKTISVYLDELCDMCKMSHTINLDYPDFKRASDLDFSDVRTVYTYTGKTINYNYIFWVQSKMADYRLNSLPFLVSLGDCTGGDLSIKYLEELLYKGTDVVPFSYSPFEWRKENELGFSCPIDFGNSLLRGVALSYSSFDLVVGTGNYDLSSFPDEISVSEEFNKFIERSFTHSLIEFRNQ
jgi:hypothetical protein